MKTMLKTLLKTAMAATLVASAAMAAADGSCNFRRYSPAPVMQPAPAAYGWNQGYGVQGHQGGHPLAGLNEIRARQSEQLARIEHGFHHGSITRWEYRRLMAEQHDISAMERAFVSDGFLSPHERSELHRRLDVAAHHIFAEARNAQRRL